MKAIVHFRTVPDGAYKYIKRGQARGFWRVLLVSDPKESKNKTSRNVLRVFYEGREGIRGVTPRSNYYIGADKENCTYVAEKINDKIENGTFTLE